jgi:hypothetical protein
MNFENINFLVKIQDIPKFETQNKINITMSGYEVKTLNEKYLFPIYHNPSQLYEKNIDLLYLKNSEGNLYYCWVKSLSMLLNVQIEIDWHKQYFCRRYLHYATREENRLKTIKKICFSYEPCVSIMPKEEDILKFKNTNRMLRHSHIIYCDSESVLATIQSCEPSPLDSCTQKMHLHIPCGFGIYVKSIYNYIKIALYISR